MHEPYLYIVMRSDIKSLRKSGKSAAQAAHAANAFQTTMQEGLNPATHSPIPDDFLHAYDQWRGKGKGQGFGTTIVLKHDDEVDGLSAFARREGFISETVTDRSFPVRISGVDVFHEVETCCYIFTHNRKTHYPLAIVGLKLL